MHGNPLTPYRRRRRLKITAHVELLSMLLRFDPLRAGTAVRFSVAESSQRETTEGETPPLTCFSLSFLKSVLGLILGLVCTTRTISVLSSNPRHAASLTTTTTQGLLEPVSVSCTGGRRTSAFFLFLGSRKTPTVLH